MTLLPVAIEYNNCHFCGARLYTKKSRATGKCRGCEGEHDSPSDSVNVAMLGAESDARIAIENHTNQNL